VGAVYNQSIGGLTYAGGAKAFSTAPDRLTPFSQRLDSTVGGSSRTDLFSPGAPVTSSGIDSDTGESTDQGTSQATPSVSGVILLMQEYHVRRRGSMPSVAALQKWL